ncbi:hypothetical protein [Desulfovibrio inopinatus]|uniref:hypothetical protein n=1 Tax=Desulfovibrio inopinatus TaxID=102109 RepID=UPI00041C0C05|nr:hypothetical protein [Desulfovibrio inopinatus]
MAKFQILKADPIKQKDPITALLEGLNQGLDVGVKAYGISKMPEEYGMRKEKHQADLDRSKAETGRLDAMTSSEQKEDEEKAMRMAGMKAYLGIKAGDLHPMMSFYNQYMPDGNTAVNYQWKPDGTGVDVLFQTKDGQQVKRAFTTAQLNEFGRASVSPKDQALFESGLAEMLFKEGLPSTKAATALTTANVGRTQASTGQIGAQTKGIEAGTQAQNIQNNRAKTYKHAYSGEVIVSQDGTPPTTGGPWLPIESAEGITSANRQLEGQTLAKSPQTVTPNADGTWTLNTVTPEGDKRMTPMAGTPIDSLFPQADTSNRYRANQRADQSQAMKTINSAWKAYANANADSMTGQMKPDALSYQDFVDVAVLTGRMDGELPGPPTQEGQRGAIRTKDGQVVFIEHAGYDERGKPKYVPVERPSAGMAQQGWR